MSAWLILADGHTAMNLDHVARFEIRDGRTPNGMAGKALFSVAADGTSVQLSPYREQGAKDDSRPRAAWFDGATGRLLDRLISALADAAAGDRPLIRLTDLEALDAAR